MLAVDSELNEKTINDLDSLGIQISVYFTNFYYYQYYMFYYFVKFILNYFYNTGTLQNIKTVSF